MQLSETAPGIKISNARRGGIFNMAALLSPMTLVFSNALGECT